MSSSILSDTGSTRPAPHHDERVPRRRVGYVCDELFWWHDPGAPFSGITNFFPPLTVQPGVGHWEDVDTKRRMHSLLHVSGIADHLTRIAPRRATHEEVAAVHDPAYMDTVRRLSEDKGGELGDVATMGPGGLRIVETSAGGVIEACTAVWDGKVDCAYALVRPPGHHAERDRGMGFCIYNNVAIAVRALQQRGAARVAVVDYDVHHGNGTEQAFWSDPSVLFMSLHQDNNYPPDSGGMDQTGDPDKAPGANINVPLPPGSGTGAYEYSMTRIVRPALRRFKPDFIVVSSGFDASYVDPLSAMMLSSEDFRFMATMLLDLAAELCHGRVVFAHEGGYSKEYVPFCGLAVVEALVGIRTETADPFLPEVQGWGYRSLQPHQKSLIDDVAALHKLHTHDNEDSIKQCD
eukprot:m.207373 g.207373  ORF g.207373 m.207373 type:complete len:406 (-) comp23713_c0_seq1:58-1275(-)